MWLGQGALPGSGAWPSLGCMPRPRSQSPQLPGPPAQVCPWYSSSHTVTRFTVFQMLRGLCFHPLELRLGQVTSSGQWVGRGDVTCRQGHTGGVRVTLLFQDHAGQAASGRNSKVLSLSVTRWPPDGHIWFYRKVPKVAVLRHKCLLHHLNREYTAFSFCSFPSCFVLKMSLLVDEGSLFPLLCQGNANNAGTALCSLSWETSVRLGKTPND